MFPIALFVFACFLALLLVGIRRENGDSDLDKLPNAHFTCPYSNLWLMSVRWRQREHRTKLELHRKLGPIVRVGPRELSINCIDDGVRVMYGGEFVREGWYVRAFGGGTPYMFTMVDKHEHAERKRMLSSVYTRSSILNSPAVDDCVGTTLTLLRKDLSDWAQHGTDVEMLDLTKACIMDITTAWLYGLGNGTGFLRDLSARGELLQAFQTAFDLEDIFWRGESHWVIRAMGMLRSKGAHQAALSAIHYLDLWGAKLVMGALGTSGTPCSHFGEKLKKADPGIISSTLNSITAAELLDHTLASYSVTSIALTYVMLELSKHPEQQRNLRKELAQLKGQEAGPHMPAIQDLPLLDAIITETLRLRSPNPGPWPRVVPIGGCRLAGARIPGGTVVSATSWTLHRNPDLFPSPEEWRPERWLEADDATEREMRKWLWAFGSGATTCTGRHFIMQVMKLVLQCIYSEYETSPSISNEKLDMDQIDAFLAGPKSDKVFLKFSRPE